MAPQRGEVQRREDQHRVPLFDANSGEQLLGDEVVLERGHQAPNRTAVGRDPHG